MPDFRNYEFGDFGAILILPEIALDSLVARDFTVNIVDLISSNQRKDKDKEKIL